VLVSGLACSSGSVFSLISSLSESAVIAPAEDGRRDEERDQDAVGERERDVGLGLGLGVRDRVLQAVGVVLAQLALVVLERGFQLGDEQRGDDLAFRYRGRDDAWVIGPGIVLVDDAGDPAIAERLEGLVGVHLDRCEVAAGLQGLVEGAVAGVGDLHLGGDPDGAGIVEGEQADGEERAERGHEQLHEDGHDDRAFAHDVAQLLARQRQSAFHVGTPPPTRAITVAL